MNFEINLNGGAPADAQALQHAGASVRLVELIANIAHPDRIAGVRADTLLTAVERAVPIDLQPQAIVEAQQILGEAQQAPVSAQGKVNLDAAVLELQEVAQNQEVLAIQGNIPEYHMRYAMYLLSQAYDHDKGAIISFLENRIIYLTNDNEDYMRWALQIINEDSYSRQPKITKLSKEITYASKSWGGKYFYNLKRKTTRAFPGLFASGVGLVIGGGVALSQAEAGGDTNSSAEDTNPLIITAIAVGSVFMLVAPLVALQKTGLPRCSWLECCRRQ